MSINTQLIVDATKKKLGSFFSTEAHTDADIIRYINSSVRKICISKNFTFNKYSYDITTTELTTTYTIPYQVETFYILNSEWEEIDIYDFEDYYYEQDKSSIIWIWDTTLVTEMVWDFTIYYRWFPDTITSLSSTINIPDHFYDLVVVWCVMFWYDDIKAYELSWTQTGIFNGMIKDMATRNTNTKPRKIVRMNTSKTSIF